LGVRVVLAELVIPAAKRALPASDTGERYPVEGFISVATRCAGMREWSDCQHLIAIMFGARQFVFLRFHGAVGGTGSMMDG